MNSQKADNQLNLALDLPEDVRDETFDLNVGYIPADNTWELIVKYSGSLDRIREELDIQITELYGNYAIVVINQSLIPRFEQYEEIEFIEKPKRLTFYIEDSIDVSCIRPVQNPPTNLSGRGILVAVIDSGIDYSHPDFRNMDGTTRIVGLWDQTIPGNPPAGYSIGTYYTKEQIDEALKKTTPQQRYEIVPSRDLSGHGTHITGICCGNGRASNGRYRGVAFESDILVIKLGQSEGDSFPRTSQLMEGINFAIQTAVERKQPLAINISFGNNYGPHAGSSLLERYIDDIALVWKTSIAIGTGNEGAANHHFQGIVQPNTPLEIEISVSDSEPALNIQLWKSPVDFFDIKLITPMGVTIGPFDRIVGAQTYNLDATRVYVYYGQPTPYRVVQEIYFEFVPTNQFIEPGIWIIRIEPRRIVNGTVNLWLPTSETLNADTKFVLPSVETTLTTPSTARAVISVGAYNGRTDALAPFSGRGYTTTLQVKPDLVAPGVDIVSASPGGGYSVKSGTSMATPFVTGSAALLMQWGILKGNDSYLYGEKVKAYLIAAARKLPIYTKYPNEALGWGALCLANALSNR